MPPQLVLQIIIISRCLSYPNHISPSSGVSSLAASSLAEASSALATGSSYRARCKKSQSENGLRLHKAHYLLDPILIHPVIHPRGHASLPRFIPGWFVSIWFSLPLSITLPTIVPLIMLGRPPVVPVLVIPGVAVRRTMRVVFPVVTMIVFRWARVLVVVFAPVTIAVRFPAALSIAVVARRLLALAAGCGIAIF